MKTIQMVSTVVLLAATTVTAQAQNFTFQATANTPTTVGGPDMYGNLTVGSTWTGTSSVTWADGKKSTDKYTCVSTSQPPNAKIFDSHVICDGSGPDGMYSSAWGCNFISKDRLSQGCVGGLTGRTGIYAGKGGAITFSGRAGTGTGAGMWGPAVSGN